MGYSKQIIKGVSWIAAVRVIIRVLSFIKIIVIARILSPQDLGLFGIAILVLTFVEIITETGINYFLVREKENIDQYISTAWVISLLRGILIAVLIFLSSPLIAQFFNAPNALALLYLVSFVPLLRGFINPSIIKFQKEMQFHKEFIYRSSIFLIETLISVVLVLLTGSVASLIWGMLFSVLFEVYLSFRIVTPTPQLMFDLSRFLKIIHYGKWITASTIANYFYQNGDNIAVGRMLGTSLLGIYDIAYRISLIPLSDITDVIKTVTFPVYVQIAGDKDRLLRAYFRTLLTILVIVVPIGTILFFFPTQIILFFFGEKWLAAVPVLQVLAIFGVVRAISVFSVSVFLTVEKQRVFTLITFIGLFGLMVTIIPFIQSFGIVGAALAALTGTSLTLPVIAYYFVRLFR